VGGVVIREHGNTGKTGYSGNTVHTQQWRGMYGMFGITGFPVYTYVQPLGQYGKAVK
jgi:hypothetical protein